MVPDAAIHFEWVDANKEKNTKSISLDQTEAQILQQLPSKVPVVVVVVPVAAAIVVVVVGNKNSLTEGTAGDPGERGQVRRPRPRQPQPREVHIYQGI